MQHNEVQRNGMRRRLWMIHMLMRRERPFLGHWTSNYRRLLRLPRRLRRLLQRRLDVTLAGAALLLALSRAPARAGTIEVVDGEVEIAENGRCSLIEAIHNANDSNTGMVYDDCAAGDPADVEDVIHLPPGGVFTLTAATGDYYDSATGLPLLSSEITIAGNDSTIRRDPADTDSFRLLAIGGNVVVTLNELTLSGGQTSPGGGGGAIYVYGTLVINDSIISGNRTEGDGNGGAIAAATFIDSDFQGSLFIYDSILTGNTADTDSLFGRRGGAVYAIFSDVTIGNSTLSDNTAQSGGGLFNVEGYVEITNSTFSENKAAVLGGAIHNSHGEVMISRSTIRNNAGGAIFTVGFATISGSTIRDNAAEDGGGILNDDWLLLTNSTVSGNQATRDGGGLFNHGRATIINSTLTGNTAQRGGGIYNTAYYDCPYGCVYSFGTINLAHSLVSGNIAADEGRELFNGITSNVDIHGVVNANNFNLFGYSGDPGLVNVDVQPLDVVPDEPLEAILDPLLADNDGRTETHRLVEGSPALDIAPNEACNAEPVHGADQRGWRRNADGVGEISDHECDVGAYELQLPPLFAPVIIK